MMKSQKNDVEKFNDKREDIYETIKNEVAE